LFGPEHSNLLYNKTGFFTIEFYSFPAKRVRGGRPAPSFHLLPYFLYVYLSTATAAANDQERNDDNPYTFIIEKIA